MTAHQSTNIPNAKRKAPAGTAHIVLPSPANGEASITTTEPDNDFEAFLSRGQVCAMVGLSFTISMNSCGVVPFHRCES
jgi:hypothetical protein